jgi:transposase
MKDMRQKGMSITQIAEELGRDRKTVRKWLQETEEPTGYPDRKPVEGKLDGYKDYIRHRMTEGCLNASVLLDEIRERGYTGSSTILRVFIQPLRPAVQSKATERFETLPGEQAQVDWGHFRVAQDGKFKRLYAFVMVLGYSRGCTSSIRRTSVWKRLWAVIRGRSSSLVASRKRACTTT